MWTRLKLKVELWWKKRRARNLMQSYYDHWGDYDCGRQMFEHLTGVGWKRTTARALAEECKEIEAYLADT